MDATCIQMYMSNHQNNSFPPVGQLMKVCRYTELRKDSKPLKIVSHVPQTYVYTQPTSSCWASSVPGRSLMKQPLGEPCKQIFFHCYSENRSIYIWHVQTLVCVEFKCAQTPLYQAIGMSTRISICSCLCSTFGGFQCGWNLTGFGSCLCTLCWCMLPFNYCSFGSPTTWFHLLCV